MKEICKLVEYTKKGLRRDFDCVWVIVGGEGMGKSHLMMNILDVYNPEASIKDIAFNSNDFINALKRQKRYGCPVFDEAGDGLYSRDAMSGINKILAKTYMAIRGLNLFTILVLPDFFDLDTYFRRHRVKGLFQVYKRGRVKFWNKEQIDDINLYCQKTRKLTLKPAIYETFPIYKGHLAEEYKEFKQQRINETLANLNKDTNTISNYPKKEQILYLLNLGFKPLELIKVAGFKKNYVYQLCKETNFGKEKEK